MKWELNSDFDNTQWFESVLKTKGSEHDKEIRRNLSHAPCDRMGQICARGSGNSGCTVMQG